MCKDYRTSPEQGWTPVRREEENPVKTAASGRNPTSDCFPKRVDPQEPELADPLAFLMQRSGSLAK
ncbi:MAG: hypothetical protein C6W56_15300 [Caldibacillus debilis]|nr:hypothetical protein [Bacillaceae bacterium]REJ23358.1 MAG: hypothetical protein C6W56_15300 [Caldibacillus debilis]